MLVLSSRPKLLLLGFYFQDHFYLINNMFDGLVCDLDLLHPG